MAQKLRYRRHPGIVYKHAYLTTCRQSASGELLQIEDVLICIHNRNSNYDWYTRKNRVGDLIGKGTYKNKFEFTFQSNFLGCSQLGNLRIILFKLLVSSGNFSLEYTDIDTGSVASVAMTYDLSHAPPDHPSVQDSEANSQHLKTNFDPDNFTLFGNWVFSLSLIYIYRFSTGFSSFKTLKHPIKIPRLLSC